MARRRQSAPAWAPVAIVVAVVAVAGYGALRWQSSGTKRATHPALNVDDFLDNGNAMRGNRYTVLGKVNGKLRTTNEGQVIDFKVEPSGDSMGIHIPAALRDFNIEREQRYQIDLELRQAGVPVAIQIQRL